MKQFKTIYLLLSLLLLATIGCERELLPFGESVPDGFIRVGINLDSLKYVNQEISTRAGELARETIIKNGKIFVFDSGEYALDRNCNLIEVRNYDISTNSAIIMDRTSFVYVIGYMNIPDGWDEFNQATGLTNAEGVPTKSYTYGQFYDYMQMKMSYTPTNKMLKSNDDGLLPMVFHDTDGTIPSSGITVYPTFDYARIDLALPSAGSETLEEMMIVNPNTTPDGGTPINNNTYKVSATSPDSKTIKGLYTYRNNAAGELDYATELLFKVKRGSEYRYYKIVLRYKDASSSYRYEISPRTRYKVNILLLNSDGYSTLEEAINLPPSNIDYDIVIDDSSIGFITNGQYYIGTEIEEFSATTVSGKSHMLYENLNLGASLELSNSHSFEINEDGSLSVDFLFTYDVAPNSNIKLSDILTKEIILPAGITIDSTIGGSYNSESDWTNSFGRKRFRLKIVPSFTNGNIIIKIGELSQNIPVNIDFVRVNTTDYTNRDFVNTLTGLKNSEGGVTGLRVANCYILSPREKKTAVFYIPVADRVNDFWLNYASPANSSNTIGEADWTTDSRYQVELIWNDGTNGIPGFTMEKAISPSGLNAIKVELTQSIEHQNVVVAVKKGATILWSWHLWITDYNPYVTSNALNNIYQKPSVFSTDQKANTINGAVHRYSDNSTLISPIWGPGGVYENKFILDRHLGAIAPNFEGSGGGSGGKGFIQYQYGSKNPIPLKPSNGGIATYYNGHTYQSTTAFSELEKMVVSPTVVPLGPSGVFANGVLPSNSIWSDKYVTSSSSKKKSIFDPCPLGWLIPIFGVTSNFIGNSTWNNGNFYHADGSIIPQPSPINYSGRIYKPGIIDAYYPRTGTQHFTSSNHFYNSQFGYVWSSSLSENLNFAQYYTFDPPKTLSGATYYRTVNCSIRPVQE